MKTDTKTWCLTAATILLAGPAVAGTTQSSAPVITGTSPNVCTITAPTLEDATNATLVLSTPGASTVTITNFVNPADATYIDGVSITLDYTVMCNYRVHFNTKTTNGALKNALPVIGGTFITALDYTSMLTWKGSPSILVTNGTPGRKGNDRTTSGAYSGLATLNITPTDPGSSAPLVAGAFTDNLTVQFGAAL